MKKILLALIFIFSITPKSIQAESPYKTALALTVTAVIAGCTVQLAKYICEEKRYKYLGKFIKDYPGVALACVGTLAGFGVIFKHTFNDSIITPLKDLIAVSA